MDYHTLLALISVGLTVGLGIVSHIKGTGKADKNVVDLLIKRLVELQKNDIQLQRNLNEAELVKKAMENENKEQEREITELRMILTENNPEMKATLLSLAKGMNVILDRLDDVEAVQEPEPEGGVDETN